MATAMSLGWVAMQASLPPVAGLVGVVEIGAARALEQIAGRGGAVAQLHGGAGQQRARQHRVILPHALVRGQVGVAHQRADAQAALRRGLDLVQRQAVHVDQMLRRFDLQLHQVQQIGAAGDEAAARRAEGGRRRLGRGLRALIGECPHAALPAAPPTSVIASTMFE
jgi:hypothetical protein